MHTVGGTFASTPVRLHNDMFHGVFPTSHLTTSTWNWGPCFRNGRCHISYVNGLRHSYLNQIYGEGGIDLSNIVVATPLDGTQILEGRNVALVGIAHTILQRLVFANDRARRMHSPSVSMVPCAHRLE